MRKKIAGFLALCACMTAMGNAGCAEKYATCGTVEAINYIDYSYQVLDVSGNIWELEDVEDLTFGDVMVLVIDDNGTPYNPHDDEVLRVEWSKINMDFERWGAIR